VSYGYPPQDPYGQQNPSGQPYGPQGGYGYGPQDGHYGPQGGYGPYDGYGGGYGPYGYQSPASNGSAVAALVCNILLLFCCMPLSIPGIVLAALSLGKINHDPNSARKLTIWAWVCFGIGLLFALAAIIFVVAHADSDDSVDTGSYQRA
jgi:hypothetical protein